MSEAYDSIIRNCYVLERKFDDQNKIINAQREELAKTRLQLGHAQERVTSLEHELKCLDSEMQIREQSSDASWVMGIWLRALGGRCVQKSHLIDGLAITTRRLAGTMG